MSNERETTVWEEHDIDHDLIAFRLARFIEDFAIKNQLASMAEFLEALELTVYKYPNLDATINENYQRLL